MRLGFVAIVTDRRRSTEVGEAGIAAEASVLEMASDAVVVNSLSNSLHLRAPGHWPSQDSIAVSVLFASSIAVAELFSSAECIAKRSSTTAELKRC
jgi:hypothetical protein